MKKSITKLGLFLAIVLLSNIYIIGCTSNNKTGNSSTLNSEIKTQQPLRNKEQFDIPLLHQRYTMALGKSGDEDYTFCYFVSEEGNLWRWIDGTKDYKIVDTDVRAILCSYNGEFIIELKNDGTLYGEGQNNRGQLATTSNNQLGIDDFHIGHLLSDDSDKSEQIIQNVKMVSVGRNHTIVLKEDNSVWLWGENGDGQMGNGQPDNGKRNDSLFISEPQQVLSDCVFVSAGNSHSAAITLNNDLYLWGDNSCGQIGNGQRGNGFPTASDLVVSVPYLAMKNVKWVRLLGTTTFAITTDNALWAWGNKQSTVPTKIAEDVLDVIGDGEDATYILDTGGKAYWLKDMYGLLYENVSSFDSSIMTMFTLQKNDGVLEVYNYNSDAGWIADDPLLVKRITQIDFH